MLQAASSSGRRSNSGGVLPLLPAAIPSGGYTAPGFGRNTIGLPVISAATHGCSDAIEDGQTDLSISVSPAAARGQAMRIVRQSSSCGVHGPTAWRRAVDSFKGRRVGEQVAQLLCAGAGA
jgi:hypothetical protein